MSSKVKALRLTLGNAPNTWHVVEGLPGFFHPTSPTPVGEFGCPTEDQAKAAVKAEGCPVEFVDIQASEAQSALEDQARLRGESVKALREQVHIAEAAKVQTEAAAVSGKE